MNREDIARMAREAGDSWHDTLPSDREFLERFAALVAAAEREACALVCEALPATCTWMDYDEDCMECAKAIRARGGE